MEVDIAVKITEDQIDDLIYFARTNDLETFSELLNNELGGQQEGGALADVLAAAVEQPSGNTPLHMAAANGHEEIIRYILSILLPGKTLPTTNTDSAPPTITSSTASQSSTSQPSPSSSATATTTSSTTTPKPTSSTTTSTPSSSLPTSSPLPQTHPLNHKNASGNTALHWASLNGHLSCTRLLADAGADLSIENDARHDALEEAERAGRADVARFLLARMSGKTEGEIVEAGEEGDDGEDEAHGEEGEEGGGVRVTQEQLERLGLEEKGKQKESERGGVSG